MPQPGKLPQHAIANARHDVLHLPTYAAWRSSSSAPLAASHRKAARPLQVHVALSSNFWLPAMILASRHHSGTFLPFLCPECSGDAFERFAAACMAWLLRRACSALKSRHFFKLHNRAAGKAKQIPVSDDHPCWFVPCLLAG